jgi:Ca-activated chloride channel family protein
LWYRARRPSGDWERVCDPHLLRWLSQQDSATVNQRSRGHWLAAIALTLMVLALSGPSWQKLPDGAYSARDARVIVLDLSSSMLAEDLRPNRLTRARYRIADLLKEATEGQTGMVAFAGDAYVVSPLTTDTNTIANMLPALRPDVIPVGGSRADLALGMAATLLERAGFSRGEVLLVTDSADASDTAKARELRDRGITTSVLGVGTVEGSPIPSGGGFLSDRAGNVVIARLDASTLQNLAMAGGGRYSAINTPAAAAASPWVSGEGSEFALREDSLDERWKDFGPWLILLMVPLVLGGFRRGVLFFLPWFMLSAISWTPSAHAGWWENVWERKDQQAWKALENEEVERAAALAVDPDLSGEAWYRSGRFDNALGAWSENDTPQAHYNQGNALAHLGEYDAAIQAYDQALTQDPSMLDAQFNRDLVEQLKQQEQEQREQDEEGESQDGESSDQEGESESSEQSDGEPSEEGESSEESEGDQETEQSEGEPGEEQQDQPDYAESWSEEDAQAMEQWLRRIPDDPGGLLRRKFINQHQRRGAPEDESEPW